MRKQTPPYSIQIELTEGCNLGCSFCGLRGIRETGTTPHKFMTKRTVERIATQIKYVGWNSRIVFAMHGEPTLNPHYPQLIQRFKKLLPNARMAMITNCFGIVHGSYTDPENPLKKAIRARVELLKNAGLNDLICDSYAKKSDAYYVETALEGTSYDVQQLERGVPFYSDSNKNFRVLFAPSVENSPTSTHRLCNHCGAAGALDESFNDKRCSRPFRELSIRWDGWVSLCCNDFRGEYPVGNINDTDLEDIWYSEEFEAARRILLSGNRRFTPCNGCNALSHRVGLLPDTKGQETLPAPTRADFKFVKSVVENGPLSEIVRRPWEDE